jgi:hypothetical protein
MSVDRINEAHIAAFRLTVDSPLVAFTRTGEARMVRIPRESAPQMGDFLAPATTCRIAA